jgi:hypothetical protein
LIIQPGRRSGANVKKRAIALACEINARQAVVIRIGHISQAEAAATNKKALESFLPWFMLFIMPLVSTNP